MTIAQTEQRLGLSRNFALMVLLLLNFTQSIYPILSIRITPLDVCNRKIKTLTIKLIKLFNNGLIRVYCSITIFHLTR
jgi:hypothetical protein